jgi:hypothetical protein
VLGQVDSALKFETSIKEGIREGSLWIGGFLLEKYTQERVAYYF